MARDKDATTLNNEDQGLRRPEEAGCRRLDGRTWLRYSISVWDDLVKTAEERALKHPAMFPTALIERLLEVFCPPGGVVLDPFMGSGSTVVGAYRRGHRAIGFELSPEYVELTTSRLGEIHGRSDYYPQIVQEDSRKLAEHVDPGQVHLCITSPPYWDILNQRRSADGKGIRNYGDNPGDLGSIQDYQSFLSELGVVFEQVFQVLAPGSYCVVVVMDIRKGSSFYPYHMDVSQLMREIGFVLDDIIVWDRRQEYNNLRPLGYPHVFRVNKVHEFILIFQKRTDNR
ncbi:MAG: site-specific DNA-methyltransferase [Firmicutes bacterium]|jgi:DNA modification methylase|nr:site-specific DNA-methyltransferase [Bacillota bacterium]